MGKNLIILPTSVDHNEFQERIEQNPGVGSMLSKVRELATRMSPTDIKLYGHRQKWWDGTSKDGYALTFREFIEKAISPFQPTMGDVFALHEEWIDVIEVRHPTDNLIIFGPPDSGKSTFFGVNYPLYMMYRTKGHIRMGYFAEGLGLASRGVIQVRETVESNPIIQELGIKKPPGKPEDWGKNSFTVIRPKSIAGSTMKAYGIGGSTQGIKIDLGILDDVVSLKNSSTPTNRKTLSDKFQREVDSRVTQEVPEPLEKARFLGICTACHIDDLNHVLARGFDGEEPTYVEKRYKAYYTLEQYDEAPKFVQKQLDDKSVIKKDDNDPDDPGEVIGLLCPERLPLSVLKKKMAGQTKFFQQNFMQEALSDDDYTISPALIAKCLSKDYVLGPELWKNDLINRGYTLYFVLDPAIKRSKLEAAKKDTDYWVFQARAYNQKEDKRFILDYIRDRGMSVEEAIALSRSFYDSFLVSLSHEPYLSTNAPTIPKWFIEDVAAQDFLIQAFEAEFGPSFVMGLKTTHVSKQDGFIGLPAVQYVYERNGIVIPIGDKRSENFASILVDELSNFGNGITKHDDVAMCELLSEQAIAQLYRRPAQPIDVKKLGLRTRGPRHYSKLPSPRERSRQQRSRAFVTRNR